MSNADVINITNILIATATLGVSSFAVYFAWKAYDASKELSFPRKNARKSTVEIKNFSKHAIDLESVLQENMDRKIYLNLLFDCSNFDYIQPEGGGNDGPAGVTIWTYKHDNFRVNDTPNHENAYGYELHIEQDEKSTGKCGYHRGFFKIQGPFYIHSSSGPYQGLMCIVMTPVHVN